MQDEENQGLLPQNPQDVHTQRFSSESNWEAYNTKDVKSKQPEPNKLDAVVILILLVMIGLAGFGVVKHFEIEIPKKPLDQQHSSAVQDVYTKISQGIKAINTNTTINKQDEVVIDSVINDYISNIPASIKNKQEDIEQYTEIKTEWVDDEDDDELLVDLIINTDTKLQIIKPVFSKSQYTYSNTFIKTLQIKSDFDNIIFVTLQMGRFNDPEEKTGLTELVFRCLQTEFQVQVFDYYTHFQIRTEDVDGELINLKKTLMNPIFTDIQDQSQQLYDDLLMESKIAQFGYLLTFFRKRQIDIVQADPELLRNHLFNYLSSDTLSLIVRSNKEFQPFDFDNHRKQTQIQYDNFLPQGQNILKYKSNYEQLSILTFSEFLSCQRFLKYVLPKPFKGSIQQSYMLITFDVALAQFGNSIHQLLEYFKYLKDSDETQLLYLYSQMLATEELLFNTKFQENLNEIGMQLFDEDPAYVLRGQESMPIFDKEEFDLFLDNISQQFVALVASNNFVYEKDYTSQTEDVGFIQDAVLSQKFQEFAYDLKPFTYTSVQKYGFQLPPISPFIPENVGIVSVCNEPIYGISGLGNGKPSNLNESIRTSTYDGSRELKLEVVNINVEFPMPDFKSDCEKKEKKAQEQLIPFQLANNVWWKPSARSAMVFTGLFIEKPESNLAYGKTMLKLLQKYYQHEAKQQLEQEFLFGYEVQFKESINGMNIHILSYSEKQPEFLDKVFDLLNSADETLFQQVKEMLKKDIKRFNDQKIQLLTQQYYLPKIMLRPVNSPEEILDVLNGVKYKEFVDFKNQLLQSKIQILNLGNILPQESVFSDSSEMYWTRTLKLQGEQVYAIQRESDIENQSAIVNYYQIDHSIEFASQLEVYTDFLQEQSKKYFAIGLQVQIKRRAIGCKDGMQIYMQGELPQEGNQDIKQFLIEGNTSFNELNKTEIKQLKEQTIQRLKEEIHFNSLQEEGNFIWDKIVNQNYQFDEPTKIIEYLEQNDPTIPEFSGSMSVWVYSKSEEIQQSQTLINVESMVGQEIYECFYTI